MGSCLHYLFMFPGPKLSTQIVLSEVEIEPFGYAGALTTQRVDDILWGKQITWGILTVLGLSSVCTTDFWL